MVNMPAAEEAFALADELLRTSGYAGEREQELAALTDPRVREAMKELGIKLVSFRELT